MVRILIAVLIFVTHTGWLLARQPLSPEKLLSLGRVSAKGLSQNGKFFYYGVSTPSMEENKNLQKLYQIPVSGGLATEIGNIPGKEIISIEKGGENIRVSPDGKKVLFSREVKLQKIHGQDWDPRLGKSNIFIYDDLNQRHWDTWEDGAYSHVFVADLVAGYALREKDIMPEEWHDCPQKPFGGEEDILFTPDSRQVLYVTKKKSGRAYAESTNTDLYLYDIETGKTDNITEGMMGYDTQPLFSHDGKKLAWLSMARDGFEADKNELWVMDWSSRQKTCLTRHWDETVSSFVWSENDQAIYLIAPFQGTEQIFSVALDNVSEDGSPATVQQVSRGNFDITGIAAQQGNILYVTRTDMNRAAEVYTLDLSSGYMEVLTHVNDAHYAQIETCPVRSRYTSLENGQQVFSWVIYPPDFDSTKTYPLLLYCQGGPQSALSQFYSFRWNFQLMASQGYIVIAPNRTGMPGWGTQWNEAISTHWGDDPMRDYLAVVDDISEEPYINKDRRAAVGASYGGYSVFMLAGIHENRFKTFIAHDGLFDLRSWYGTTEELWFANWDIGGPYWSNDKAARRSYDEYNPSSLVEKWTSPILIYQGGKDYRVPIEQGMQAFQAARILGLKSRFVYMPEENHWVLKPQTALQWHREFYRWLKETL